MNISQIITIVGIPTIGGMFVFIGRKLQILDDVKKTIEKIKNNVKAISDALVVSNIAFDSGKLHAYSPTALTSLGEKYLADLGFVEIFKTHRPDFFSCVDAENPKTKFDVESASARAVLSLFGKEYFGPIKEFLYNNPKADRGELVKVAGIYVRDRYFEQYPEIR